jgi:hypothetical protein
MSNTPINYKIIEADGPSKLVFPLLEPSEVGSNIPNAEFYMLEASIHGAQTPTVRKHSSMSQVSYHDRQEIPNWLLYTMLFSTTIICFGNYYVYDFPQALQTPFNDKLGIGPSDTNLFYSAYGLPNMFLTFFGGVFIQCMGDQKALLTFVTLIVSGQAIFGIGTVMNNYWLMFAGRVVFGLGGENNLVVQCFVVEKWFSGRMVSIAFGLVMIFNLAGTTLNNFLTPLSYELLDGDFGSVFLFSFIPLGVSVAASITYCVLDTKYSYLIGQGTSEEFNWKQCLGHLKGLSPIFWGVMAAQLTISNVYYQFMNFGTSYSQIRYNNTYDVSKNYMTVVPFVIMFCL